MYTVQFYISGYSAPAGTDVEHFSTLNAIRHALQREHEQAEQYGAGYEPSEAVVWKGEHFDATDLYPDFTGIIGPRGGVQFHSA